MSTTTELVLDKRRRTTFTRVGKKEHERYIVQEFENGQILLTPAMTVSVEELELLRNPAIVDALREASAGDRSKLRRRPPPKRRI